MSKTAPPARPGPQRVLLLENIHPGAREMFAAEGFEVESLPHALPEKELRARIEGAHILGIRSKTQVREAALEAGDSLLAVGCFCIGTNQVSLESAKGRGLPVFNAPFSNTRSVAEMIIAEVIFLARQLGDRSRELHAGRWRKASVGCHEVRGKTLGVVGYGHIGSQVGVLAEAMGLRVLFFDIQTKLPMGNNRACDTLDELLDQADFVTCHVPETPQTHKLIGRVELAKMRQGAYLLNASRGTVVDIPALAEALRGGHLAGAAVDVYPEEPEGNSDGFESELRGLSNVLLTPHIGGSTAEAQAAIGREVATSLIRFAKTGGTIGAVNFPHVELAPCPRTHRVLNVHRNVPGVLRDVNRIVSERNGNIHAQVLATDAAIGYLVMDIDQDVSRAVGEGIAALATSLRTRVLS
jgi:D-3-phosphoglycerate dehydrogenase